MKEKKEETKKAEDGGQTIETMSVRQLEGLLKYETSKTQEIAESLVRKLKDDTSLLEMYRKAQSQKPPEKTAEPTKENEQKKDWGDWLKDTAGSLWKGVSDFFQDSTLTPEQKAIKHKKALLETVESLVSEKKMTSPAILAELKQDIEREYARLVPSYSADLTTGNKAVIAGALGFFAINWYFSESFSKAAWHTFLAGGAVTGIGFAAYAAKDVSGLIGEAGQKVWSLFEQIPGVAGHFQKKALKKEVALSASPEVEEMAKIQRLRTLLALFRRGGLHVDDDGTTFRDSDDLFQQILYLADGLKTSKNRGVQAILETLQREKTPEGKKKQADSLLEALNKLQLGEIYKGKVPEGVLEVLRIKHVLLSSIRSDTNDIPREENGRPKENFSKTVDDLKKGTVARIQAAKEKSEAYFRRMAADYLAMTELKEKAKDDEKALADHLSRQQDLQNIDPEERGKALKQLSGIVGNIERATKDIEKALSQGSRSAMFDTMIGTLNNGAERILKEKDTKKVDQGRYEEVDRFTDFCLIMKSMEDASSRVPQASKKDDEEGSKSELTTQAILGVAGYSGLSLYGGAGLAFGFSAAKEVVYKPLSLVASLAGYGHETNVAGLDVDKIADMTKLRAYGPNILFGGLALALASYHFRDACHEYQTFSKNFSTTANALRALQIGVRGLSGVAAGAIGVNALAWRSYDLYHIRKHGDAHWGRQWGVNLLILASLEAAFATVDETLARLAMNGQLNDPKAFEKVDSEQLFGLFALYQENWPQYLVNGFLRSTELDKYFSKVIAPNVRRQMRGKILAELGKRLGGLDESDVNASMLPYYRKYAKEGSNYNYDENKDRDVLFYSIWYAQLVKARVLGSDIRLDSNHAAMKARIDQERQNIETLGLQRQMSEKSKIDEAQAEPALRYVMEGFKGNVRDMLKFYQMCVLARDHAGNKPEQKKILEGTVEFVKAFIEVSTGGTIDELGAVGMEKNDFTFQDLQEVFKKEKEKKDSALVEYEKVKSLEEKLKTSETVKEGEVEYWKGKTDLLLHRKKENAYFVFLGGHWREAPAPSSDSAWQRQEKKSAGKSEYGYYTRTVDGVTYLYLPLFNCFLTTPPANLPEKKEDFYMTVEKNGNPREAKCNINDMKMLTAAFIPQNVFEGLVETALPKQK